MDIYLQGPTIEYVKDIEAFRREIFEAKDKDEFAGCFGRGNNCGWKRNEEILDSIISGAAKLVPLT